jgi:hypothetical protein
VIPGWVALVVAGLGVFGTLAAAVLTQVLTNRRESQRDQLKWAQERQQRELDVQKAAFAEARTVLNDWHRALRTVVLWVGCPEAPKPEVVAFSEHLKQANSGLTTVELVCSQAAVKATHDAVVALTLLHHTATTAARETEMNRSVTPDWRVGTPPDTTQVTGSLGQLLTAYRAELTKLSTMPISPPQASHKRFRLSWRRYSD